jgi:hypothetical protein
MKKALLLGCAVFMAIGLVTSGAYAADIAGEYAVVGQAPKTGKEYAGTVTITKTGDVYKVSWDIGGKGYVGTGILVDDVLSVAYTDEAKTWFGIVAYQIKSDGAVLEGKWTGAGATAVGGEVLTRR